MTYFGVLEVWNVLNATYGGILFLTIFMYSSSILQCTNHYIKKILNKKGFKNDYFPARTIFEIRI